MVAGIEKLKISEMPIAKVQELAKQADANKNEVIEGDEINVFVGLLKQKESDKDIKNYLQSLGLDIGVVQQPVIDTILLKPVNEITDADKGMLVKEMREKSEELKQVNKENNKSLWSMFTKGMALSTGGGIVVGGIINAAVRSTATTLGSALKMGMFNGGVVGITAGLAISMYLTHEADKILSEKQKNIFADYKKLEDKYSEIEKYNKIR